MLKILEYYHGVFEVGYLTTISMSRLYSIDDRMINELEQLMESELARETEVLGESPPQCYFVHHKFLMT
jgi:hypothetical protein